MGDVIQFKRKEKGCPEDVIAKFATKGFVLNYKITKQAVLEKDYSAITDLVNGLYTNFDVEILRNKIKVTFLDYEDDPRQLYEIPEIRDYIKDLLQHNFVLFFMLTEEMRIHFFLSCANAHLEDEDDKRIFVRCEINEFMLVTIMAAAKALSSSEKEENILTTEMLKSIGYLKAQ